jgi:hypothetical protein
MTEQNLRYVTYHIDHLINDKQLQKRVYFKNNKMYNIYNSSKTSSIMQEYRSVVFSFPENKVLSFSPPRSVPYEKFKTTPMNNRDNIIMSEIVEGVMINLFYDHRISSWEIATKSAIGGDYNYSDEKRNSFREMFFECLHCEKSDGFLDVLPKNYSYSFVIQHPKNKLFSEPFILWPTGNRQNDHNHQPCKCISIEVKYAKSRFDDSFKCIR